MPTPEAGRPIAGPPRKVMGGATLATGAPRPTGSETLLVGVSVYALSDAVDPAIAEFFVDSLKPRDARLAGAHFPENSYDNNTTSFALFFGWLGPTILVAIMATFRAIRKNVGLRSTERTPNKSLERTREG